MYCKNCKIHLLKRFLFIMKFIFLFFVIGINFSFALSSYSQATLLSINAKDKIIKDIFNEIEKSSEFIFIYQEDVLELNKKVSINVSDENITNILDKLFESTNIQYIISDRQIALSHKASPELPSAVQQGIRVTGTVSDVRGETLPGVVVAVRGTSIGTTTNINGEFSIAVPSDTSVVQFSFIGYQTENIVIGNRRILSVTLREAVTELDDVTVVAFATQKKESVISSISTVKPAELKVPSSNLTTAFAGKIAGVIAYQRSGEPGQDNADFFIRGVTTFGTGKADPLILIDNVELSSSDLARLNTDDIASFSILKDAAATALYGARGANGVILVTTKEGKEGKVSVSFRFENSFSSSVKDVEIADPLSFMKLHNEAVRTRDPLAVLPYLQSDIAAREEGRNPYVYPMVDWKNMLFKDFTTNQRANLNLSGGGNVARYYVALSYNRDNGILSVDPVNNFNNNIQLNKYTVRSNVNLNLTKTTELIVRVSGTFDDYQGPITSGADMYNNAIKANPVLFPATYEPDEANQYANHILFGNSASGDYMNPYAEMLKGYKEYQNTVVIAQLELKQDLSMITKGLKARVLGTTTRNSYYDLSRQYNPFYYLVGAYDKTTDIYMLTALNPDTGTDYLNYVPGTKRVSSSIYMEAALSYDRIFAEKHTVSGMLVYTAREALTANETTLQNSLPSRNLGLAGRFTYGLLDRYFVEANFGYNGSERFDRNHRWGFFPSGGLGWIVSKESFWESSQLANVIQLFKLKASYGIVGNDEISNDRFFYLSEVNMNNSSKGFTFGTDFGRTLSGISISRYADNKIGWEISHKLNLGVEMKFFNSLDIQVDYFTERRTNILQTRADIPTLMGLQVTPSANLGEAKGKGIDASVDYQKVFNKDFWLTVRGNFTYATSKYTLYEEPDYSGTTPWLSRIGQKISQKYGLIAERLFVDEQDVLNSPKQQFGTYMAGDIKYKDINNDEIIDNRDKVPIGYPTTPEIIYGFGFSAGYKNFDFSCFFQGSARSSFWIDAQAVTPFVNSLSGLKGNNAVLQFIENDHWSEANQNVYATWPRLSSYHVANNGQGRGASSSDILNTWFMRNGNFLRLKSAELGYTLPKHVSNKINLKDLRVYLSGTNLFCISNFKLWDPEMGGNGLGYPIQRVINIGLQLSF